MAQIDNYDILFILQKLEEIQAATYSDLPDDTCRATAIGKVLGANTYNKTTLKYVIDKLKNLRA